MSKPLIFKAYIKILLRFDEEDVEVAAFKEKCYRFEAWCQHQQRKTCKNNVSLTAESQNLPNVKNRFYGNNVTQSSSITSVLV